MVSLCLSRHPQWEGLRRKEKTSEGNVDAIKRLEMYPVCICDSSGMKGRQNAGYIIKV